MSRQADLKEASGRGGASGWEPGQACPVASPARRNQQGRQPRGRELLVLSGFRSERLVLLAAAALIAGSSSSGQVGAQGGLEGKQSLTAAQTWAATRRRATEHSYPHTHTPHEAYSRGTHLLVGSLSHAAQRGFQPRRRESRIARHKQKSRAPRGAGGSGSKMGRRREGRTFFSFPPRLPLALPTPLTFAPFRAPTFPGAG